MDTVERVLLNTVQTDFPVTSRPYQRLGELAGVSEEEAWQRITQLRQEGIIRRLGGVFDSHRLGYYSTLCAAKVPQEKIRSVADFLNGISGVTHNYLRAHDYNMWFTLIAATEAEVETVLNEVRRILGLKDVYSLPAKRLFKISVDFEFEDKDDGAKDTADDGHSGLDSEQESAAAVQTAVTLPKAPGAWDGSRPKVIAVSERDKEIIRLLQGNLPFSQTPFAELAQTLQWREQEVLAQTESLKEKGLIRRFGAVLRHQKAGFTANAMGVWQVSEEKAPEIGAKMASFREVSHCYQRPSLPDWPYTLFTMIHGHSAEDCQAVMQRIAQATGVEQYQMLFSQTELKKSSMQYFMEEND